jgi:hypothetical protein
MEILNVRKLVALDIALHGSKFILAEFGLGVPFAIALGWYSLRFSPLLGAYVIVLGLNYVPPLLYAIDITRKRSAKKEAKPELSDMKKIMRLSVKQFVIFVPFSTILLSLSQELRRRPTS